jgi:hypothetical protein
LLHVKGPYSRENGSVSSEFFRITIIANPIHGVCIIIEAKFPGTSPIVFIPVQLKWYKDECLVLSSVASGQLYLTWINRLFSTNKEVVQDTCSIE